MSWYADRFFPSTPRTCRGGYYVARRLSPHPPALPYGEGSPVGAVINRPHICLLCPNLLPEHGRTALAAQIVLRKQRAFRVAAPAAHRDAGDLVVENPVAQAGSGDLLTGMIAGLLTMNNDVFQAVCMAVWLHGYLAEEGTKDHAANMLDLSRFPALADSLYFRHGF